jgi:dolichyl-phosphate beta-glucosyltransferase
MVFGLKRNYMSADTPFLSVIIPSYNEQARIGDTLTSVLAYLQSRESSYEIIIVDDGSRDKTCLVVGSKIHGLSRARLIAYQPNRGKGYAVRQGMLASRGEVAIFTDADLSTPVTEIEVAVQHLQGDFDVVIGSRALAESKISRYQPQYRRVGSRIFNILRDGIVGVDISRFKDTQCGFKAFRGPVARRLFGLARVDGFMFDVETLYIAIKLGYRIFEMPVHWTDMPGSKLRLVRDTARMFRDLAAIRFAHRNIVRG